MRNGQVGVRVGECHDAIKLIKSLCDSGEASKVDWVDKPGKYILNLSILIHLVTFYNHFKYLIN